MIIHQKLIPLSIIFPRDFACPIRVSTPAAAENKAKSLWLKDTPPEVSYSSTEYSMAKISEVQICEG